MTAPVIFIRRETFLVKITQEIQFEQKCLEPYKAELIGNLFLGIPSVHIFTKVRI